MFQQQPGVYPDPQSSARAVESRRNLVPASPNPPGEVPTALAAFAQETERTKQLLATLAVKLSPLLPVEPQSAGASSLAAASPFCSPLAREMNTYAESLRETNAWLASLTERVAL